MVYWAAFGWLTGSGIYFFTSIKKIERPAILKYFLVNVFYLNDSNSSEKNNEKLIFNEHSKFRNIVDRESRF
ncbi:hypothetical protein E5S67_01770 [Microcoleus sp. IPMA8]|uniref:Uncharacterized protein n=1 Tax=Microcoleus asticus IPMA8 TaxID=2563858 RepID=A0ABX2CUG7_9CYAN|nr:hypothetical protein [Microcoleus asticus IPMA8]